MESENIEVTDQPYAESNEREITDQPDDQESIIPDRYISVLSEAGGEPGGDEEDQPYIPEEGEESIEETMREGNRELVRVSFKNDKGEDVFGYLPEGVKGGFLRDADYTQKSQEVAIQKQEVESSRRQLEVLEYVDILGRLPEERPRIPRLREDYLMATVKDEEGYEIPKYESDEEAREAYANDLENFNQNVVQYDRLMEDKKQMDAEKRLNREKNKQMISDFEAEFGKEALHETLKEVEGYINHAVFRELKPYKPDALRVLYLGMNHEKLLNEAVRKARMDFFKNVDAKPPVVLKGKNQPRMESARNENVPKRYEFLENEK